jgi:Ca-activated chloride channel family protein
VSIAISVDAGVPLADVASTYHNIRSSTSGSRYSVRLVGETVAPDHDFELAWTPVVLGEPVATLFREPTESGEHVLLMFMPPHEPVQIATPRELIFVIDTSGSMSGTSIEQARAALLNGLTTLKDTDKFNVIQFNSIFDCLFPTTVPASAQNIAAARNYVRALTANGGTEMLSAMSVAMGMPVSGEYLRQIIFITDGAVGNEDQLFQVIQQRLDDARLFTVGIGSAPNGHFMRKAAQMGRGTFTFIGSTHEVDERMGALLHKLKQPTLTNIEFHWPQGVTPEYAPARIGDLYAGEPLVISARVSGQASGLLSITGHSTGVWSRQLALDRNDVHGGVATLWARNRISDLMDLRANGADDATLRAQVLPLALQYQLVTSYTSLVAVDHTPARPTGEALDSRRIANTKPQGSTWPTPGYPQTATSSDLQLLIGLLALLLAGAMHRTWRSQE